MDAYHPHIPFPKSDYFSERTDARTDGRTEFGNLILCAPTYRALRAIINSVFLGRREMEEEEEENEGGRRGGGGGGGK